MHGVQQEVTFTQPLTRLIISAIQIHPSQDAVPLVPEAALVGGGEVAPDERLAPQRGRHAAVLALVRPVEPLQTLLQLVQLADLAGNDLQSANKQKNPLIDLRQRLDISKPNYLRSFNHAIL